MVKEIYYKFGCKKNSVFVQYPKKSAEFVGPTKCIKYYEIKTLGKTGRIARKIFQLKSLPRRP